MKYLTRTTGALRAWALAGTMCALLAAAVPAVAVAGTYLLHGGDQLSINVYGDPTLTGQQTVLPDGSIEMPLVGKIHVGGQTPEQAAQTIADALRKYLRRPVVTVAVTQQGPVNVLVLGNVKNPGKYALQPAGSMLTDAIAAAGGMGPVDGPYPNARIASSGGGTPTSVSLEKLLHDGDLTNNAALHDGEVVYIPSPVTFNVYVAGAVDHPGEIPLNQGDNVAVAVIKAGDSPTTQGDYNNIKIVRTLENGQTQTFHVDLYKLIQDNKVRDFPMQKGDIVYVPQIPPGKHVSGIIGPAFFYLTNALHALFPGI